MSKRLATEGMKNSHLTGQNLQRNQKIICRDQLVGGGGEGSRRRQEIRGHVGPYVFETFM